MRNAYLAGSGHALPEKSLKNQEAQELVGEDITQFMETLGIERRYIAGERESTSSLAVEAGKRALEDADLTPEDVDLLLLSTDTPDIISPPSSASVAGDLGLPWGRPFFDINASCTGFVIGTEVVTNMIKANKDYNNILLICSYLMTSYAPLSKGKFNALFSDGAGAALLSVTEDLKRGYVTSHLIGDGREWNRLGVFVGGTRFPPTPKNLAGEGEVAPGLTFYKGELLNRNPELWPLIIREALKKASLEREDVDLYIFTQINKTAIKMTCENLEIPFHKTYTIMEEYGYTGNACLIMALDMARRSGRVREGDLICLTASGVGYTMGSLLIRL